MSFSLFLKLLFLQITRGNKKRVGCRFHLLKKKDGGPREFPYSPAARIWLGSPAGAVRDHFGFAGFFEDILPRVLRKYYLTAECVCNLPKITLNEQSTIRKWYEEEKETC